MGQGFAERQTRRAEEAPGSEVAQGSEVAPVSEVAPGTATGVPTGLLPAPEVTSLLRRVLWRRQHVHIALLLTQPACILEHTHTHTHTHGWFSVLLGLKHSLPFKIVFSNH